MYFWKVSHLVDVVPLGDCHCTVDDRQMGHIYQVRHLSKTPLNLLKIHEIGSVDTFESKQQNYDQIWHMWPPYQILLGLSHLSWLSHSPVRHCTLNIYFGLTWINVHGRGDTTLRILGSKSWPYIYYNQTSLPMGACMCRVRESLLIPGGGGQRFRWKQIMDPLMAVKEMEIQHP